MMQPSPTKTANRLPLKETDSNLRTTTTTAQDNAKDIQVIEIPDVSFQEPGTKINNENIIKKRSIEKLESLTTITSSKKKPKIERTRSIEGAVLISKPAVIQKMQQKVTPKELIEWQINWKKIMRRDSRIYFDTTEDNIDLIKSKKSIDKKKELLKRGFYSLGAEITKFFDTSVTIVITTRSTDNIHLLNDKDILSRAKKNFMKVWGYEKAFRFLTNLDVDFNAILKNKTPILATPSLSNLLQNEKIYGPNDRDPRTKRDDIHYFKYPHVYMYDLWQTWAPIITLEWRPQDLNDDNNLPYPILKMGTFGRCPFIGDRYCDENSSKRIVKRYKRDKLNSSYAMKLRQLYQHHALPSNLNDNTDTDKLDNDDEIIIIPHGCLDSSIKYHDLIKSSKLSTSNSTMIPLNKDVIRSTSVPNLTIPDRNQNKLNVSNNNNKVSTKIDSNETISDSNHDNDSNKIINEESQSQSQSHQQEPTTNENNTNCKEPPTPSLKHAALIPLTRTETEDLQDDLCTTSKKQTRIPFEIRASGVHQSNDVATSFGNGLGPTKATVMSKNIKTLNKLLDWKLDTPNRKNSNNNSNTNATSSNVTKNPKVHTTTTSSSTNKTQSRKGVKPGLTRGGSNLKHSFGRESLEKDNQHTQSVTKEQTIQTIHETKPLITQPIEDQHVINDIPQPKQSPILMENKEMAPSQKVDNTDKPADVVAAVVPKRQVIKNPGYCENCRVKYESLDEHIVSEKHLSFANNKQNFEPIDSLIEKLRFQF